MNSVNNMPKVVNQRPNGRDCNKARDRLSSFRRLKICAIAAKYHIIEMENGEKRDWRKIPSASVPISTSGGLPIIYKAKHNRVGERKEGLRGEELTCNYNRNCIGEE